MIRAFTVAFVVSFFVALGGVACGQQIEQIDLHDRTIPTEARRLVADAEDSIDIARAKLEKAKEDRKTTVRWRRNLFARDWPSAASSALEKLRSLADARVQLGELQVRRAEENVELAEAKYRLITAKTAIRHDLAVYELEPLRETVDRERSDVENLDGEILSKRQEIARLSNSWWQVYAQLAREDAETRAFFVSAAEEVPVPKLRDDSAGEQENQGGDEKSDD